MSGVVRNIDPHPLTPGECVPPRLWWGGGRTHSLGGEGVGGSIVRKTPDTALYSVYVSTLWLIRTFHCNLQTHLFMKPRQVVYTVRLQCFIFFFPRKLYKNTCNTAYIYSTYIILFRRYNVWRKYMYIVLHCCSMHILLTPFTIQNALLERGRGRGRQYSDTNKQAHNFFSEIISSALKYLCILNVLYSLSSVRVFPYCEQYSYSIVRYRTLMIQSFSDIHGTVGLGLGRILCR
jgi:hypothetical protein